MICKDIHQPEKGFYYDLQLNNPLLKVSLHPSTIESEEWPKYSKKITEGCFPDCTGENKYRLEPICSSIVSEDFQISVTNTMSNFGGDPIGQLWNDTMKPLSPYLKHIEKDLVTIGSKISEGADRLFPKDANNPSEIKDKLREVVSGVGDFVKSVGTNGSDITKRSLVVQGTQFSYYSGTNFEFGGLLMKFVLFSGYDGSGKYVSVPEQVDKIKWYVVGSMKDVKDKESNNEIVKEFVKWQLPPGGYVANIKNYDMIQYGTLRLVIGSYYHIDNLVIQSAQFNYSKTFCKDPKSPGNIVPLYCEVTLNLRPVSKFSDKAIFNFAHGVGMSEVKFDGTNTVKTLLEQSLAEVKTIADSPNKKITSC